MIALRAITAADVAAIHDWPTYPPEFADIDYALRPGGWISEHLNKPDAMVYIAEQDGEIAAFTTFARTGDAEAEFRIAMRPDKIGLGLGITITEMTLAKGFKQLKLARIQLIVRKNNPRAIGLYKRLGFTEHGECLKIANGKQVEFMEMDISRESYEKLSGCNRNAAF